MGSVRFDAAQSWNQRRAQGDPSTTGSLAADRENSRGLQQDGTEPRRPLPEELQGVRRPVLSVRCSCWSKGLRRTTNLGLLFLGVSAWATKLRQAPFSASRYFSESCRF